MSKFDHIFVLALVCLWIGSPALACLPSPQMTHSEMECCKKMAGDCHMGTGQHPCCKTVSNASNTRRVAPACFALSSLFRGRG